MARTLKPITPDKYDWRKYNRTLHQVVLYPLIKELNKRIVRAERDYKSVQKAIKNIKTDPSMAGLTGAAAKTQAAKLLKQHNAEFERTMREHMGIRYRITDNYRVDQLMQKFIKDNVSLVKTIPPRLHAALERDIIKLQQKGPFDQKALSDTLSKNYNSAGYNLRRLTRDQTSKAVGNLNHIRQTDAGLTEYIWRTSMDERVRSSHRVLRGRRFKWSSPPPEGHPGHPIQCFPGSVHINPSGLERSVSYRYIGKLIKIFLADGVHITTTPNHPILTESGWKRAEFINQSDKLLVHSSSRFFFSRRLNPDINKTYPTAENLHGFLGGVGPLHGSAGSSVDLHSGFAIRNKNIEVIDVERELRDNFDSIVFKMENYFRFKFADMDALGRFLPSLGHFDNSLTLPSAIPGFIVRSRGELPAFKFGHSTETDSIRFAPRSGFQSQVTQAGRNDTAIDSEGFGHSQNRYFGMVHSLDFTIPLFSAFDIKQPVSVSSFHFDGPVYSFETESELILANGIVTHNCRCYAEGVMPPIREVKKRQARIVAQRPQPTGKTFLTPPKRPIPPPQPAKPKFDFVKDTEKALQNVPEGYGGMDVLSVAKARWGNQAHQVAKSGKEFDGLEGQILTRAIANDEFLDGNIEGKSGGYGVVGNGLYFAKYKKGGKTRSSSYFEGGGYGERGHMYSVKLADDAKVIHLTEEIEEQIIQFKKDVTSGKIKAPIEVLMFVSSNMYDAWAFYNGVDAWTGLLGDMVVLNRRKVIVDPRSLKDGEFYKEANSPGFKKYRYDEIVDKMKKAYDK